jgi:hypothetical protein
MPVSIEGWLVMAVFVAAVVADVVMLKARLQGGGAASAAWTVFFAWLAALVVALCAVCWMTGERPRWHWGD